MSFKMGTRTKPSEKIVVMTPPKLGEAIVNYYKPTGSCLEPCRGTGNIWKHMPDAEWCEISEGRDFFEYNKKIDWIITNPPFKGYREWFKHSAELADNIVFLCLTYHLIDEKTIKMMRDAGYGIVEILYVKKNNTFVGWPGYQAGVVYWKKGWEGACSIKLSHEWLGGIP